MIYNVYIKTPKSALFLNLFYLCMLFTVFACKNPQAKSLINSDLPYGNWQVVNLKNNDQSIIFDTNKNYFVELNLDNRMIVTAEDNRLSSYLINLPSDSLNIKTLEITDVCCNSKTANALFDFFATSFQITQHNNKLIISSENGVLELMK